MRRNTRFLVLVTIAAAVFYVFVCPYLSMQGYGWACWVAMGLFVVLFLYGRVDKRVR